MTAASRYCLSPPFRCPFTAFRCPFTALSLSFHRRSPWACRHPADHRRQAHGIPAHGVERSNQVGTEKRSSFDRLSLLCCRLKQEAFLPSGSRPRRAWGREPAASSSASSTERCRLSPPFHCLSPPFAVLSPPFTVVLPAQTGQFMALKSVSVPPSMQQTQIIFEHDGPNRLGLCSIR